MQDSLTITLVDPRSTEARAIVTRFFDDIVSRYWGRPATTAEVEKAMRDEPSDDLDGDGGFLLIVRDGAEAVGCGGMRVVERGVGEVTRVFTDDGVRGRGVGRAVIAEIESISARRGIRTLRLTVREDLTDAHRLYRRLGYEPVEPFSASPYADHQLAKTLAGPPEETRLSRAWRRRGASSP